MSYCASLKRYSIVLLRFYFLSHVQVFSSVLSIVVWILIQLVFFPLLISCFVFLIFFFTSPFLLQAAIFSFFLYFVNIFIESFNWCIHAIHNGGISSSPVSWHILSVYVISPMQGLEWLVINFIFLRSICLRPSLVHFKNGSEYLSWCLFLRQLSEKFSNYTDFDLALFGLFFISWYMNHCRSLNATSV